MNNISKKIGKTIRVSKKIHTLLEELKITYCQKLDIAHEPFLDTESIAYFTTLLGKNRTLLEYGAGGSSIYASAKGTTVISVETSRRFADAVNQELLKLNLTNSKTFSSNVGLTRLWGTPVDRRPTKKNLRQWFHYVERPWKEADRNYTNPDLVLVDGRFRTACTAYSALQIRKRRLQTILLVDDFKHRPIYRKIFAVCDLIDMHGRTAELKPKLDIPEADFTKLAHDALPDIL